MRWFPHFLCYNYIRNNFSASETEIFLLTFIITDTGRKYMTTKAEFANPRDFVLSRSLVFLMSAATGITVANLYYIQPLLAELAKTFHVSQSTIGFAAMLVQAGYALGMLLIVPLGDMKERRSLIVWMLVLAAGALVFTSFAANIWMLLFASLLVGLTSVVPQLIVPFAAHLAPPGERGKVVGTVMSGLLIGILLSRTFSGVVGDRFGWQLVYQAAAVMMIFLVFLLRKVLPESRPSSRIQYVQLLKSLWGLFRENPVLREASYNGALMFGTFSAFWTTLVFFLRSPVYNLGTEAAGLFGLVGVFGALTASVVGRIVDKKSPRFTIGLAIILSMLSYICFFFLGYRIWGLVSGVILLDIGTQTAQISNQARIYAMGGEIRNRVNAVYMVSYFIGGGLGSLIGSFSWGLLKWPGVCLVGLTLQFIATVVHTVTGRAHR